MQLRWTIPIAAGAFLLALALVADPALAAPPAEVQPSDVGDSFGEWIRGNFIEITLGCAGVIGLAVVAKRDVQMGLVLVVATLLTLGFFIQPNPYLSVTKEFFEIFSTGSIQLPSLR